MWVAALTSALTASSAHAAEDARIACPVTCSGPLAPGERLVAGDKYAGSAVKGIGSAGAYGIRFGLKWSPDGVNFYRLFDTEQVNNDYVRTITRSERPDLFPGYFRLVALNTSPWQTIFTKGTLLTTVP